MMIFFNFDEDIRKDLIEQGYKGEQFTSKFEKMKKRKILIGFGMNHEQKEKVKNRGTGNTRNDR